MAVRQYIGARYVPRFLGTYDVTQIYDALDVVDNGSGTSYIARKTVPAGTPLTDTEFWFVYGASSGAIIQLQNDMIQAQNDILSLDARIDLIEQGEIICVSDSYGHYPSVSDNWISRLGYMVSNTIYKAELSGAAFGDNTKSFVDAIELVEGTIPDPNKVSAVVLCGGRNDYQWTDAQIDAGMSDFSTYVATHYPNAMIYLLFVGLDTNMTTEADLQERVQPAYQKNSCIYKNMCYVQGSELVLRRYDHLIDVTHPNASGATDIARAAKGALMLQNPIINSQVIVTGALSHSGPATAYSDITVKGCQVGSMIRMWAESAVSLVYGTSQNFIPGIEIGTLNFPYIKGTSQIKCKANIPLGFKMTSVENYYQSGAGRLYFNNGKVYLSFMHPHGVDEVRIPGLDVMIPTMFC